MAADVVALPQPKEIRRNALDVSASPAGNGMTFTAYLEVQAHRDPTDSDAYIRVRVPNGPSPDGSVLVYLPNGTGLVVNSNQLLHLDAGPSPRPRSPKSRLEK